MGVGMKYGQNAKGRGGEKKGLAGRKGARPPSDF